MRIVHLTMQLRATYAPRLYTERYSREELWKERGSNWSRLIFLSSRTVANVFRRGRRRPIDTIDSRRVARGLVFLACSIGRSPSRRDDASSTTRRVVLEALAFGVISGGRLRGRAINWRGTRVRLHSRSQPLAKDNNYFPFERLRFREGNAWQRLDSCISRGRSRAQPNYSLRSPLSSLRPSSPLALHLDLAPSFATVRRVIGPLPQARRDDSLHLHTSNPEFFRVPFHRERLHRTCISRAGRGARIHLQPANDRPPSFPLVSLVSRQSISGETASGSSPDCSQKD